MLAAAFAAPINHALLGAPWALEALKGHAGKTAQFDLGPFSVQLTVSETGEVRPASADAIPDARFNLSPALLLRALQDREALKEAEASGDSAFATAIAYVGKHLAWDVEEDLSKIFGDILAHRMVGAASDLNTWRQQTLDNFLKALKEYWTEERALLAKRAQAEEFVRQVDRLRDDVERLEKRLERIARTRRGES